MKLHLGKLVAGDCGTVAGYAKGAKKYREKLLSMGLTRNTEFSVTRMAPLGDPVEIEVRGFSLSLRKDEAAAVLVDRKE